MSKEYLVFASRYSITVPDDTLANTKGLLVTRHRPCDSSSTRRKWSMDDADRVESASTIRESAEVRVAKLI